MINKKSNRRYYLHRCVKRFIRTRVAKTLFVPHDIELNKKQDFYVKELQNKYGYSVQTEIR